MGTVTYTKSERVKIELDEDDMKKAVGLYLGHLLSLPNNADFLWLCGQEEFSGAVITWDETPPPTVESTSL